MERAAAVTSLEPLVIAPELFRELDARLIALLKKLSPDDWNRPTVCSEWSVKDVASHLLDTALRRLSDHRDAYRPPGAPSGFASGGELVRHLHRMNAEWTTATRRLSPRVLIALSEEATTGLAAFLGTLDPMAPARWPVAWAGEAESKNWMDVAREYTERWHHQQQIATAVGVDSGITARHLYHPVLAAFARALPVAFAAVPAPEGAAVSLEVAGEAGGEWFVVRRGGEWVLGTGFAGAPAARAVFPQDVAWLALTKRWDRATKLERCPGIRIEGDGTLGSTVLDVVGIMA